MSIKQVIISSYSHQSGGPVEAHTKLMKCTIKKCLDTYNDVNQALLQRRSTPIGAEIPRPATVLLNKPIIGLLPQMNKESMKINNDDA